LTWIGSRSANHNYNKCIYIENFQNHTGFGSFFVMSAWNFLEEIPLQLFPASCKWIIQAKACRK